MARVLCEEQGYRARLQLSPARMAQATHLIWATGGSMVPETEMAGYLAKGRQLLQAEQDLAC
jgi:D-serine dehydratase